MTERNRAAVASVPSARNSSLARVTAGNRNRPGRPAGLPAVTHTLLAPVTWPRWTRHSSPSSTWPAGGPPRREAQAAPAAPAPDPAVLASDPAVPASDPAAPAVPASDPAAPAWGSGGPAVPRPPAFPATAAAPTDPTPPTAPAAARGAPAAGGTWLTRGAQRDAARRTGTGPAAPPASSPRSASRAT